MSSASIKKIIPCNKNQLIEMVLDIEKYPEFVPWCLSGRIHSRKESSDLVEIKADLKVGKSIINETYTSLVHYYKEKDKIWELLNVEKQIGISLTESRAMFPAASVCGWYFSHPKARYFSVLKNEKL